MSDVTETIRNNYTVSVVIDKTPKEKSILLPVSSIVKDNAGNSYVYIKGTGTEPIKKQIKTGEIKGTEVEIIGLSTTDQVVEVKQNKNKKTDQGMMGGPMGGGEGGPPPGDCVTINNFFKKRCFFFPTIQIFFCSISTRIIYNHHKIRFYCLIFIFL